jgi:hypothetical protein
VTSEDARREGIAGGDLANPGFGGRIHEAALLRRAVKVMSGCFCGPTA